VIGGSTPVDGEELTDASALGDVASALEGGPESGPVGEEASGRLEVDASVDPLGGGLPMATPEELAPPLPDEPEKPDELAELGPAAPAELFAPASAPDPGGVADSVILEEPPPQAAMTIATPKHDSAFLDGRSVEHPCCEGNTPASDLPITLLCTRAPRLDHSLPSARA
jgi:hypothetical protein